MCVSTIGLFVMPYAPLGVGHKSLGGGRGAGQGEGETTATGAPTATSPHRRRKGAPMNDLDERKYAWRMIHTARKAHDSGAPVDAADVCRDDIIMLLDQALDAGLDRVEIIVELVDLGARMFALCNPVETADPVVAPGHHDDAAVRGTAIRLA